MAPITITVVTEDRKTRSIRISDQTHLDSWLEKKLKVESLAKDGVEDDRFEFLVDGGTYTLGPPIQQQQQQEQRTQQEDMDDPNSFIGRFLQQQEKMMRGQEEMMRGQEEMMLGVKRQIDQIYGRPTPMYTPATFGKRELTEARRLKIVSESSSHDPSSPAVLDGDSIHLLSELTSEHQVVAFLTPVFEEILQQQVPGVEVVNSEEHAWLVASPEETGYKQRPDNIFCHIALYERRTPFKTEDANLVGLRRPTDKYGVLVDWALRDCIDVIGEAKIKINNAAFGEVLNYARHVCVRDGPKRTKILLYDKNEFWAVKVISGEPSSIVKRPWGAAGSRQDLVDFFQEWRSPWVELLMEACEHLDLEVESGSFLGKGAFGRVFKVVLKGEGRRIPMALKLVLPGHKGNGALTLMGERRSLVQAASVLPDAVVGVKDFYYGGNKGAALLLAHIGSKVPQKKWRQLFETLGLLHQRNILHGDPRLPNAIYVQGKARWIDFRGSRDATSVLSEEDSLKAKQIDIDILVNSCCVQLNTTMGTEVKARVRQYDGTAASAVHIYEALQSS